MPFLLVDEIAETHFREKVGIVALYITFRIGCRIGHHDVMFHPHTGIKLEVFPVEAILGIGCIHLVLIDIVVDVASVFVLLPVHQSQIIVSVVIFQPLGFQAGVQLSLHRREVMGIIRLEGIKSIGFLTDEFGLLFFARCVIVHPFLPVFIFPLVGFGMESQFSILAKPMQIQERKVKKIYFTIAQG